MHDLTDDLTGGFSIGVPCLPFAVLPPVLPFRPADFLLTFPSSEGLVKEMIYVVCAIVGAGVLLSWGLVHGAAKLRSPEEQAALDDEQAQILAEWAREHGKK